jgi:hypothetical protein
VLNMDGSPERRRESWSYGVVRSDCCSAPARLRMERELVIAVLVRTSLQADSLTGAGKKSGQLVGMQVPDGGQDNAGNGDERRIG